MKGKLKVRSVLKVVYIVIGIIVCIFSYILSYSTNSYNYIKDITNEAISSQEYQNVAKIHGGCFDVRNLVDNDNSDSYDLAVFPSATLSSFTYKSGDNNVTDYVYENSYYVYLFNLKYDVENYGDNNTNYNYSGLRFSNSDGGQYDYYFTLSENINSNLYASEPTSANTYILNAGRNMFDYYNNYGFINLTLTESLVKAMSQVDGSNLNNDIDTISILNSRKEVVGSYDINLNFEGEYFTAVSELVTKYNAYILVANNADASSEDKTAAETTFNTFYESFEKSFLSNENYSFRYSDDYLQPVSIIWQSVGITVLFIVCAILIYILLFHFKFLKGIFNRNSQKYDRYKPKNTSDKNAKIITAKVQPAKTEVKDENNISDLEDSVDDLKDEEVKDENNIYDLEDSIDDLKDEEVKDDRLSQKDE